jgi:hypothetical protein
MSLDRGVGNPGSALAKLRLVRTKESRRVIDRAERLSDLVKFAWGEWLGPRFQAVGVIQID